MADPIIIDKVTDSAAAEQAFREGRARFRRGQKVVVRPREGGAPQIVDASEVSGRLEGGWQLATDGEVDTEARRQRSGTGLANEVKATAAGALRAGTLGASDVIARVVSDDAVQELSDLREFNPGASQVGEFGTDLAIGVATGGLGLLKGGGKAAAKQAGKAAVREGAEAGTRAALAKQVLARSGGVASAAGRTPVGLATRLAAEAEIQVAKRTGSRAAQLAASASIEGGLMGAGQGLSQAALDTEREFTADRALAHMARGGAEGFVLGGLTGGVLGAGITSASRLATRGVAGGKRVAASLRKKAAVDAVGDAADARTPVQRFRDQSTARHRLAKTQDDTIHGLTDDLDETQSLVSELDADFSVGRKIREFEGAMDSHAAGDADDVLGMAAAQIDESDAFVTALVAARKEGAFAGTSGNPVVNKLDKTMKWARAEMGGVAKMKAGNARTVQAMRVLDEWKLQLGRAERQAIGGANPDRTLGEEIAKMREGVRVHLEDDALYGGAARLQQEYNPGWVSRLEQLKSFNANFLQPKSRRGAIRKAGTVEEIAGADPEKLAALVRGINKAEFTASKGRLENMREGLTSQAAFFENAASLFGTRGAEGARLKSLQKATKRALDRVDKMARVQGDADAFGESLLRDIPIAGRVQDAAGKLFAKYDGTARALTSVQSGADSTAIQVSTAVQTFLRKAAGKAGGTAARAVAGAGARAFTGRDRDEEVAKIYAAVESYESDPVAATRRTHAAAGVHGVAPAMAAAMAARGAEVAGLLASKLPRKELSVDSLYGGSVSGPPEISEMEKDEILAYARAAMDPMSVVDDFQAGQLSFEGVDALRTAWPGIYTQMRDEVIDGLGELEEPPPYGERLQLGLLLDIPTDETLEPQFIASIQASASGLTEQEAGDAQQATMSPSRRSSPDLAEHSETKSQRIAR